MYIVLVLLNFSKAFNTLDFEIFLKILEFKGFEPISLKLFASYLKNRSQRVKLDPKFGRKEFLSKDFRRVQYWGLDYLLFRVCYKEAQ